MSTLDLLKLPETKHIQDLDAPETTLLHGEIIRKKGFLRNTYLSFYNKLRDLVGDLQDKILVELGSGGGFLQGTIPNVIKTDILSLPHLDARLTALKLPFQNSAIDAFLMVDVFHHIPNIHVFLSELNRCLKEGGRIVMIEPANTLWGSFVYRHLHHEDFNPKGDWSLDESKPLTAANGALPWIVFKRDRRQFETLFPSLTVQQISAHTPFLYLLSGGFTFRQLLPSWSFPLGKGFELLLSPLNRWLGMFYTIEIQKLEI